MAKRRRQKRVEALIDIVIPVYGEAAHVARCLEAVRLCRMPHTVTLVDDCGPEDQQDALAVIYSNLRDNERVIRNSQNLGFPRTVNRGASVGRAPTILILNSDVILADDAIPELYKTIYRVDLPDSPINPVKNMPVGIAGAKLVFSEDSPWNNGNNAGLIQHAGIIMDLQKTPQHYALGWDADHWRVNVTRAMQFVTGAVMMVRRDLWQKITDYYRDDGGESGTGAFSEVYGRGTYEDIELCIMARLMGYQVVYCHTAEGTHVVGASSAAGGDQRGFDLKRNHQIFSVRCGQALIWDQWFMV